MTSETEALQDSMRHQLDAWRKRYHARPELEMKHLLLLALEREEIVTVGYRDALVHRRLQGMRVTEEVRALIRHAMIWIWQDEAMHVIYARGAINQLKRPLLTARAAVRDLQGIIGGWAGGMEQHVRFGEAPVARSLSKLVTLAGSLTGAVPKEVREHLRYRPFREYCLFNVAAERTASLVYERLIELASSAVPLPEPVVADLSRVRDDEYRHERVFAIFAQCLDSDDRMVNGWSEERLVEEIGAVSPFFLPSRYRKPDNRNPRLVGGGGRVVVRKSNSIENKLTILRDTLDSVGLPALIDEYSKCASKSVGELKVVIKPTFMMLYSHRDPSPAVDPEVIRYLGEYLHELGARSVQVIESSKVYEDFFSNRDVSFISREFGFESPRYTVMDCSKDVVDYTFPRGLGESCIARAWKEADFRINLSKLRSHPIERALLTLPNLEGLGRRWTDFMFSERQASYRTATLMIHDAFPAHLSLLDAFVNAPDGPLGVMGTTSPKHPLRFYASCDPLALDMVASRHMGLEDPLESPMLQTAVYWFGDPSSEVVIDGPDDVIADWHGPCHNDLTALFSLAADVSYRFFSGRGAVFVPQMDPDLFPPVKNPGLVLRCARGAVQRVFGLHAP